MIELCKHRHTYIVTSVFVCASLCGIARLEPNWGNYNAGLLTFIGNYSSNQSLLLVKAGIAPILHSKGETMVVMFDSRIVKVTLSFFSRKRTPNPSCVSRKKDTLSTIQIDGRRITSRQTKGNQIIILNKRS